MGKKENMAASQTGELHVGVKGFKQGQNVKDVIVPEQFRNRRLLGVKWFDEALGNEGLVPSTVSMVTGSPGAGKSTMLRQLADAITGSGHVALYNSGEESPYQIALSCERLKLQHGFILGQETETSKLFQYADNVKKSMKPGQQLFILQDSLQLLNDGKYADGAITSGTHVRVAADIVSYCKKTWSIALVIGHSTKDGKFAGRNTIIHHSDAHMELVFDTNKKSETYGERLFRIPKNRWGMSGAEVCVGMSREGLYEKAIISKESDEDEEN